MSSQSLPRNSFNYKQKHSSLGPEVLFKNCVAMKFVDDDDDDDLLYLLTYKDL